jgi:hypothetical protein
VTGWLSQETGKNEATTFWKIKIRRKAEEKAFI